MSTGEDDHDQLRRDAAVADGTPPDAAPDTSSDTSSDPAPVGVPPGAGPPLTRRERWRSRRSRWVVEWLLVLLVAVGVALGIRAFVVQTYFIPSASMQPTLLVGDRILVDKLSYRLHGVGRGDIVVFATPPREASDPTIKDLVKRVIGMPGDVISSTGGRVYINGRPLREPWLSKGTVTTGVLTRKVPPNEYFVMGDNRSDSQDSRFFGPIRRSLIVGRVVLRIWPLSRVHFF